VGAQVYDTDSPGNQFQRIQNATGSATNNYHKAQGTNGLELQCVHSPLSLLNSKNLLTQNKSDHLQLSWFLYLKNTEAGNVMEYCKHSTEVFLDPNEYLLTLISIKMLVGKLLKS
jgi:hypothetical protein